MRRATEVRRSIDVAAYISIHAPHEESDLDLLAQYCLWYRISIHAPHEESDGGDSMPKGKSLEISIHAPHEESDLSSSITCFMPSNFNPRSPWGERRIQHMGHRGVRKNFNPRSPWGERHNPDEILAAIRQFQSTLPMRRATITNTSVSVDTGDFNPRSPWGERPVQPSKCWEVQEISIHAPHEESDKTSRHPSPACTGFQSTLPMRRATCLTDSTRNHPLIFQSTLPMRRATRQTPCRNCCSINFNPRSPWGERHKGPCRNGCRAKNFNPRSPWGERPRKWLFQSRQGDISIHAPHEESDSYIQYVFLLHIADIVFIHLLYRKTL